MNHEVRRAPEAPDEENAHDQPPFRLEDLRGADLTRVEGLLPEHLAGADLTGAKLPDDLAKFPTLSQVTAISSEARKIFIGLIAGCVYCWLVMGTTRDVDLILNTASSPLPIINTPIPIAGFYVIGAALLAGVYCYLHFYLHHLWRNLAALPAVFPDGIALDDRSDPWLLTKFVRVYFVRLNPDKHPLKRLETVLSVGLAWALVPLTLFALWARYLPSHDPLGTYWLGILTMFTMVLGWHFFRYARATLRGEAPPSKGPGVRGAWRELRALGSAGRTFFFLVAFTPLFLALCSYAVFHVDPHETRTWAQRGLIGLRLLGIRTYADLREVELAERPEGWTGREWSTVKRVDLRGRNLAFADATRAFLANADLRGATLTGAIFNSAELRGAVLYDDDGERGAQAQGINFRGAKLQDVDLRGVNLKGANLVEAQLHGADLRHAQLQGANLSEANFQGADLRTAQLQGANLSKGQFQGADLRRAKLQCANLSFAQLQGANLRDAELHMAGLGSFQGRRAGPWGLVPGYGDPQLQGGD